MSKMQSSDQDLQAELQQINKKTNEVVSESLASTRRMVQYCSESETLGIKTAEMLAHQEDQLNQVAQGMHHIKDTTREAEKHLSGMEKVWGIFSNPFDRSHKHEDDKIWKSHTNAEDERHKALQSVNKNDQNDSSNEISQQGSFITKITGDHREDEMEQNLQQVNSLLGNMKNMAIDIGNNIEVSNRKLQVLSDMAQSNDLMIHRDTKRIEAQLK